MMTLDDGTGSVLTTMTLRSALPRQGRARWGSGFAGQLRPGKWCTSLSLVSVALSETAIA